MDHFHYVSLANRSCQCVALNAFLSVREEPMYRVFEHSQVVLSGFQCMYVMHEASLQSHELYCDDPNRL